MKQSVHRVGCKQLAAFAGALTATLLLVACGPVRLTASANIPTPLVMKIPIGVALFVPKEFSEYSHKEERWGTDWNINLGAAHTEAVVRLMNAMFERVVTVDSVNAGAQPGLNVSAILEPSVEEYAFVTPRDAGSPFYAVSIKYRLNVYAPDGRLAESWGFTGYGTSPSQGISSTAPLALATSLALRDAGAKLAVEFREQAVVRGLLPGGQSIDAPPAPAATEPTPTAPAPAPAPGTAPEVAPAPAPAPEAGAAPKDEPGDGNSAKDDDSADDDSTQDDSAEGDDAPDQPEQPEEKPVEPEALAVSLAPRR